MAKKSIKSTTPKDEEIENDEDEEIDRQPIDKAQAALLLAAYIDADQQVSKAEQDVENTKKKRSDAAKEIYNALGKGPFQFKGTYLGKIAVRDNNYHFRGKLDQKLISFD